jgi:hypothetical protein
MVNVPEEVNVCIVCPPEVVFVPPVELGETQSDPSVAYEIIIIPSLPSPPLYVVVSLRDLAPLPQLPYVVAFAPFQGLPLHQSPPTHHSAYVTAEPDIELDVQGHFAPHPVDVPFHHTPLLHHPPPAPYLFENAHTGQSPPAYHCQDVLLHPAPLLVGVPHPLHPVHH